MSDNIEKAIALAQQDLDSLKSGYFTVVWVEEQPNSLGIDVFYRLKYSDELKKATASGLIAFEIRKLLHER